MIYEVPFKFNMGDVVGHGNSGQLGIITRQWSKVLKLDNNKYQFVLSYTVQPEKTQRFKVNEDELELIE